jgi:hypothetical protein
MKLVKNFVYAIALVGALTVNIFAGEQDTPAVVTQPPPKATAEAGIFPTNDPYFERSGEITAETTDYLFFETLAALLSVY